MKRLFIISAFLSISLLANSQQKIEAEIGEKSMSKGSQMAVTVLIPDAKAKDVEPLWKKYINNRSVGEQVENVAAKIGNIFKSTENQTKTEKLNVEKKGDELYVRSIEQKNLGQHSFDIYARITQLTEGCQFSAFFQYTDSVFLSESNTDADRIQNLKSYIRDFGLVVYSKVVEDQIKDAEKDVKKQEGVIKDIESDSKKEEKSITKYEVDIQEYEANVAGIENDIKLIDEKIEAKKTAFSQLTKKTPEYDAAKGELKELTKEKSKCFDKIKSVKGKITSKQLDIKSAQNNIASNDQKIKSQQTILEEKQKIVDQLIQKKDGIK